MLITVTSIRLKSVWNYFPLTYNAMLIVRQLKNLPGFVRMKNTGFGYNHFTLSVWEDEKSMREFVRTGAHLNAMKKSRDLATEVRTFTFNSDKIPPWKEVRAILNEKGKVSTFQ